ncbi:hypothetical protein [Salinimicrobium xinjiangense]|uniref:hypothetical protein n=1 Tax=Salinimicrobium xinjiangense TaxID=438596 RepID=UPI000412016C|nr:hypothetical protein [Salinimicrobium xinjiangense]
MKKIYLLVCLFALAFVSCQKEELLPAETQNSFLETVSEKEALDLLNNFSGNRKSLKSADYSYAEPHWDSMTYEELLNTEEKILVIPATIKNNSGNSRILMMKLEGFVEGRILTLYKDEKISTKFFSGKMSIKTLDGESLVGYKLNDGVLVSKFLPKSTKSTSKTSSPCDSYKTGEDWNCGELDEVYLEGTTSEPTPYVSISTIYAIDGGGTEEENYYYKAYDDGGGGGGGETSTTPEPNEEEDKIDDSELKDKEKCINDLLDKNGNSFVKDLLAKFKGDGTEFDIKILSKDKVWSENLQDYVNAITRSPVNNVIEIHISSTNANGNSALAVTRTLLHEYIHADIFRKLESRTNTILELNFKNIFEQYEEDHHETMASLYVESMRDALKNFHQTALTADYNAYVNYFGTPPSDFFYEALAWQGLKNHNVQAYVNLTEEVKKLILAEEQKLGLLGKDCPQ